MQTKQALYADIVSAIQNDPDYISLVSRALSDGIALAMEKQYAFAKRKDRALLAALALVQTKRMTPDLNKVLADQVIAGFGESKCNFEVEFMQEHAE